MLPLSRCNFIIHTSGKLDQKYENHSKLGEGAFGSVFASVLKSTSELRAIKHIDKSSIKHPERLESEISTMLECDHPNIVKLFEIFEDKQNLYLVMEQCPGGELFDYIIENSKVPEIEASRFFKQIMMAVHYLHSKKIVHRDLKPENLMFSGPGVLKLIDFGIAKILQEDQEMTTRAGTVIPKQPFYMSPEILKGAYGLETDIWSAGVILYTMLCGYPPFFGNTDPEIYKKVLAGNFSFRGAEWKNVSNAAKDLIRNMLIVNTEMRYNAKQVLEHPWLSDHAPGPGLQITPDRIEFYCQSSSLARTILLSIVVHSDDSYLNDAKQMFLALDTEGSGLLNKDSVAFNLTLKLPAQSLAIKKFVEALDLNQNGTIDYSEFLTGFVDPVHVLTLAKLQESFALFDRNKNGKVSAEDLQKLLNKGKRSNLAVFKNMLIESNIKANTGMGFQEFVQLVDKANLVL